MIAECAVTSTEKPQEERPNDRPKHDAGLKKTQPSTYFKVLYPEGSHRGLDYRLVSSGRSAERRKQTRSSWNQAGTPYGVPGRELRKEHTRGYRTPGCRSWTTIYTPPPGDPHPARQVASLEPTNRRHLGQGRALGLRKHRAWKGHTDKSGRTNRTWRGQPTTWSPGSGRTRSRMNRTDIKRRNSQEGLVAACNPQNI